MLKISYAGCLGLSPVVSSQFSVKVCTASKNCEKFTTDFFEGFGVVQGHRCYDKQHVCSYLQPFFSVHEPIAVKYPLFTRVAVLTPGCAGLLEHRGSGLGLLKFTFNTENFTHRLSWSISSHFVAIQC